MENSGLDIIGIFRNDSTTNNYFSRMVSKLLTQYPMSHHLNKFITGISIEKALVMCLNKYTQNRQCIHIDEFRNDISYRNKKYSIKSMKLSDNFRCSNIRLINKHSSDETKIYNPDEDLLIIIYNLKYSIGMLIFIPKEMITEDDIVHTVDGVELHNSRLQYFLNSKNTAEYRCKLSIHKTKDIEKNIIDGILSNVFYETENELL